MRRSRAESIMRVCQIVQRKIAHGEHGLNRFGTDILKKEIGDNPLNPLIGVPFFKRTRNTQIERIWHGCRSVEGRKMFRPYRAGSGSRFRVQSVESVLSVFHFSREHGTHRLSGFAPIANRPHPVSALPKYPSPCERRGTSV
jgi:hypothetical protein